MFYPHSFSKLQPSRPLGFIYIVAPNCLPLSKLPVFYRKKGPSWLSMWRRTSYIVSNIPELLACVSRHTEITLQQKLQFSKMKKIYPFLLLFKAVNSTCELWLLSSCNQIFSYLKNTKNFYDLKDANIKNLVRLSRQQANIFIVDFFDIFCTMCVAEELPYSFQLLGWMKACLPKDCLTQLWRCSKGYKGHR